MVKLTIAAYAEAATGNHVLFCDQVHSAHRTWHSRFSERRSRWRQHGQGTGGGAGQYGRACVSNLTFISSDLNHRPAEPGGSEQEHSFSRQCHHPSPLAARLALTQDDGADAVAMRNHNFRASNQDDSCYKGRPAGSHK